MGAGSGTLGTLSYNAQPIPMGGQVQNANGNVISQPGSTQLNSGATNAQGVTTPYDASMLSPAPAGFSAPAGAATDALVPWYNTQTGQTYNAPSSGYTNTDANWIQGSNQLGAYMPGAELVPADGTNTNQPMYSNAQPVNYGVGSTFAQGTNPNTVNPYAGSTSPYYQAAQATSLGNTAGAQQATQANRVNQNTMYGGLNYQQGTDANGNPTWTANQTGTPQTQGLVNSSLNGLQQSLNNPMYGINPGQTYSDAIMQRLAPQQAQAAELNTSQLANQGIVPGTQAYDNAMRTFQQGQNDLLTSAQVQGMNTGLQAQALQGTQAGQIKSLTTPNLINAPQQAAVSGPDYTGALATQTNANIAAQNAQLGQQTNQTAGLYGLGSAGILGLAANPGLVSSAYNGISSLFNNIPSSSTASGDWLNTYGG